MMELINRISNDKHVDVLQMIDMYEDGLNTRELATKLGCTTTTVRTTCDKLNLRLADRYRVSDLEVLKSKLKSTEESPETIDILQRKVGKLSKSLQHARDELIVLRKVGREGAREDRYYDTLEYTLEKVISDWDLELPEVIGVPEVQSLSEYGLVATIGDIHFGEVVKENTVPNNTYNYDIAEARLDRFCDSIINYHLQSDNLTIIDLKDTLRGIIHNGIIDSETSFVESIRKAVEIQLKFFTTLSQVYDTIDIYSTGDNHSRIYEKPVTRNKEADYSRMIDELIIMLLDSAGVDNVNIHTTDSGYHLINVNSANILAFHGDTVRSFKVHSSTARSHMQDICGQMFDDSYRHSVNGHQHQAMLAANQYGGLSIQNGTMVGSNEYGVNSGMRNIDAIQSIFMVNRDGTIEDVRFVNLNE